MRLGRRGRASWRTWLPEWFELLEQADRDLLDGEVPEWRTWPVSAVERGLAHIKARIAQEVERAAMTPEERKAKVERDRRDLFG